jgi:cell division protein FtsB
MARPLNQSAVIKELDRVGDKLAARGLAPEKRMALLRRQAQLGDLRDAIAQRARRAAAS